MLTTQQKAHFETFGFLVLRQLFSPEEAANIKQEATEIFDEVRGNTPFTGEVWEQVQPFFERRPFMSTLADDDRVYDIGVALCGPDFVLDGTEGNNHVGDTAWHSSAPKGLDGGAPDAPPTKATASSPYPMLRSLSIRSRRRGIPDASA